MGNTLTDGSAKDRGGDYVVAAVARPDRQRHAVGGDAAGRACG